MTLWARHAAVARGQGRSGRQVARHCCEPIPDRRQGCLHVPAAAGAARGWRSGAARQGRAGGAQGRPERGHCGPEEAPIRYRRVSLPSHILRRGRPGRLLRGGACATLPPYGIDGHKAQRRGSRIAGAGGAQGHAICRAPDCAELPAAGARGQVRDRPGRRQQALAGDQAHGRRPRRGARAQGRGRGAGGGHQEVRRTAPGLSTGCQHAGTGRPAGSESNGEAHSGRVHGTARRPARGPCAARTAWRTDASSAAGTPVRHRRPAPGRSRPGTSCLLGRGAPPPPPLFPSCERTAASRYMA